MDYAAIAAKYGGTAAPAGGSVNYASLAAKYGGIASGGAPTATATPPAPTPAPQQQSGGLLSKVTDFLGISKFSQGIASAGREVAGHTNQTGDEEASAAQQLSTIMSKYPVGSPERKQAVQQYISLYKGGVPTQAEIDPGTQLSNKEVLGSAGNVALDALGGGSLEGVGPFAETGALGRIGNTAVQNAVIGGAQGASQAMNENKGGADIAKEAATNSLLGGVLGGAIQGTSELAKYLTSPEVSESLYNRAIGIDKKTAAAGRSPAADMIEQGKVGTASGLRDDAQKTIDATNSQIKDIISNDTTRHDTAGLVGQIQDQLTKQYGDTLGPEGVQQLMDTLPISKLRTNDTLSTGDLNSLRQKIDSDFVGNGKWISANQDPVKISSYKTAANVLRQTVQGQDERLPGLFDSLSSSITARNALDKEMAKPHALTHMLELLTALGAGGAGAMAHGDLGALAGGLGAAGAFHAANSTLGQTAAAVGISKANSALENPGVVAQGVKAIGRVFGRRAIANSASNGSLPALPPNQP